ncbi:MAG: transglutaminase domain-containing protein [Spirochaetes bacterium]|nr:transglutaminase domain-containing protein [Spirochaetota bacterium]
MIKKIIISFTIILLSATVFSSDTFNYFVKVKNFRSSVYWDRTSRYRLISSDEDFTLVETSYQKIIRQREEGDKKIIEIKTSRWPMPEDTPDNLSEYLKDTRFLSLSSPEITAAARRFRKSRHPVTAIEYFVSDHISEKTIGIPFLPARTIYIKKKGDCTEHTVLTVALLRKIQVPARAVIGMLLADEFMGKKNIFVYHMWAEAWVKGRWILVDAAKPYDKYGNRYVALAYHDLKTEAPVSYLRAASAVRELTVEYLGK